MASLSGKSVPLSLPRRFICDLLHASRRVPIVTFERRIDLSAVSASRREMDAPPPWSVLFAKAFAIVAESRPELRRTYVPLPWPRLWEGDDSVAAVAVEREFEGEAGVFFGMLKDVGRTALVDLAAQVREWKMKPVEEISTFRRVLRYSRLPFPLRRILWWAAMSWSGKVKARYFGTFGVSLTAGAGAAATNLIGPATISLNCGVIQSDGTADLRLHFDHRVFDGMTAARSLAEIEDVLNHEILTEMGLERDEESREAVGARAKEREARPVSLI